jgi:LuxR family transcriptional regulator, maltose regulon positive regulatory protein
MAAILCSVTQSALRGSDAEPSRVFLVRPRVHSMDGARIHAQSLRDWLIRSWRYMLTARPDESLACAISISSQLQTLAPAVAERYRLQVQLIRAYGKALSDDAAGLLLELSDVSMASGYASVINVLRRYAYWRLLRWSDLYALPMARPGKSPRDMSARVFDWTILAAAALERQQLVTASRFAADAMSLAETVALETSVAAASAAAVLASVRYELGYLDHAEQLLQSRLPILLDLGTPDVIIVAYTLMSRIAQHRGRSEHAAVVLHEGEALGERKGCSRIILSMMGERVRLMVRQGDVARALKVRLAMQRYAKTLPATPELRSDVGAPLALADVQIMLAEGSYTQAVAALHTLLEEANSKQQHYTAFRLTLELVGAVNACANDEPCSRVLLDALKTGERTGMLQSWVDAHSACGHVMEQAAEQLPDGSHADFAALQAYIRTIVSHQSMSGLAPQRKRRSAFGISARLSARERAVLVLIARGHSNKRAARTLRVTPETIKSHLKRVFVKLGAQTRAEAVSRAADLGQLIGVFDQSRSGPAPRSV